MSMNNHNQNNRGNSAHQHHHHNHHHLSRQQGVSNNNTGEHSDGNPYGGYDATRSSGATAHPQNSRTADSTVPPFIVNFPYNNNNNRYASQQQQRHERGVAEPLQGSTYHSSQTPQAAIPGSPNYQNQHRQSTPHQDPNYVPRLHQRHPQPAYQTLHYQQQAPMLQQQQDHRQTHPSHSPSSHVSHSSTANVSPLPPSPHSSSSSRPSFNQQQQRRQLQYSSTSSPMPSEPNDQFTPPTAPPTSSVGQGYNPALSMLEQQQRPHHHQQHHHYSDNHFHPQQQQQHEPHQGRYHDSNASRADSWNIRGSSTGAHHNSNAPPSHHHSYSSQNSSSSYPPHHLSHPDTVDNHSSSHHHHHHSNHHHQQHYPQLSSLNSPHHITSHSSSSLSPHNPQHQEPQHHPPPPAQRQWSPHNLQAGSAAGWQQQSNSIFPHRAQPHTTDVPSHTRGGSSNSSDALPQRRDTGAYEQHHNNNHHDGGSSNQYTLRSSSSYEQQGQQRQQQQQHVPPPINTQHSPQQSTGFPSPHHLRHSDSFDGNFHPPTFLASNQSQTVNALSPPEMSSAVDGWPTGYDSLSMNTVGQQHYTKEGYLDHHAEMSSYDVSYENSSRHLQQQQQQQPTRRPAASHQNQQQHQSSSSRRPSTEDPYSDHHNGGSFQFQHQHAAPAAMEASYPPQYYHTGGGNNNNGNSHSSLVSLHSTSTHNNATTSSSQGTLHRGLGSGNAMHSSASGSSKRSPPHNFSTPFAPATSPDSNPPAATIPAKTFLAVAYQLNHPRAAHQQRNSGSDHHRRTSNQNDSSSRHHPAGRRHDGGSSDAGTATTTTSSQHRQTVEYWKRKWEAKKLEVRQRYPGIIPSSIFFIHDQETCFSTCRRILAQMCAEDDVVDVDENDGEVPPPARAVAGRSENVPNINLQWLEVPSTVLTPKKKKKKRGGKKRSKSKSNSSGGSTGKGSVESDDAAQTNHNEENVRQHQPTNTGLVAVQKGELDVSVTPTNPTAVPNAGEESDSTTTIRVSGEPLVPGQTTPSVSRSDESGSSPGEAKHQPADDDEGNVNYLERSGAAAPQKVASATNKVPCVAINFEGEGSNLTLITIATANAVFIISIERSLFDVDSPLRKLLEHKKLLKLMFDCRSNAHVLLSTAYSVRLCGVLDLQPMATVAYSPQGEYLTGLVKAFTHFGLFGADINAIIDAAKHLYENNYVVWSQRPLPDVLRKYCAIGVQHYFLAVQMMKELIPFGFFVTERRLQNADSFTRQVANMHRDFTYRSPEDFSAR